MEILLRLKLFGHTDTLTEAGNLTHKLYKRGKIKNEQQYRNAFDKIYTKTWNYQTIFQNKVI